MQDYRTLKLLDHFERVFAKFGVDYKMMRRILQVKLTMDGRRVPTIFSQNAKKKDKELNNQYIKSLWIYVLFGLFMIPFVLMGENYLFQMSLFYGIFTFFVMTSMISDFSSVLLDVRDRNILTSKPVHRRTISAAKFMHVVIYLSFLTIAIVGIPLLVALVNKGILFFLITAVNIILLDLFIVALTALIYLFVLRFFDGEKLKDIINYVQIGLSLTIMVGYQLLVRSFQFFDLAVTFQPEWWQVFVFPMWYGANTEMLLNGSYQPIYLLLSCLGLVLPFIAIWIYMKYTPMFEQQLQKLLNHGKAKEKRRTKMGQAILAILCPSKEERAFFKFSSLMMKNEREFKLKVYPSLGFALVIPFILIINDISFDTKGLAVSKSYFSIYISLLIVPTTLILIKYSGKFKGAWIYSVAPISNLKHMFSGTIKAFLVKLFLPVYIILSLLFVVLFGVRIVPDLILVFINACNVSVVGFMMLKKSVPFSESFEDYNQNSYTIVLFGQMFIVGIFAFLHYVSTLYQNGIYMFLAIALILLVTLWKVAFNISWDKVYR